MKKALITKDLHALLKQDSTFLNRVDILVSVSKSNDETLNIHRMEQVHLIITQLDMPGMASEQLCSLIRENDALRTVSIIMVCANDPEAIARSGRCRANAVLLQPVHPLLLMVKAEQLLDIAGREMLRVLLSASIDSQTGGESFFCRSRNVSATGMLIETNKQLVEGERLSCLFYLPNERKIQATGKIIRAVEYSAGDANRQFGVMFTEITPENRRQLADFVEMTARSSSQSGL